MAVKIKENEVYHFDGGVTIIEINSPKYGQHFAVIDTKNYKKIYDKTIGIRRTGALTKKFYARVIMPRKENNGSTSKDLHIYLFGDKSPNGYIIDHINNDDTLDNREQNIRFGTRQQNIFNSVKQNSQTTSKYKGVYFSKIRNRFVAQITYNYNNIYLGVYKTQEQAAIAYNEAAIKYFDDFARLNKIEQ